MTKGAYTIGGISSNSPRKDTSFRSFICALLVFLAICLIILLASINWGNGKKEPTRNNDNKREDDAAEILEHIGQTYNDTHERIVDKFNSTTWMPKSTESTTEKIDFTVQATTQNIRQETKVSTFPRSSDITSERSTEGIEIFTNAGQTLFEKTSKRSTVSDDQPSSSPRMSESTMKNYISDTTTEKTFVVTSAEKDEATESVSETSSTEVADTRVVTSESVKAIKDYSRTTTEDLENITTEKNTEKEAKKTNMNAVESSTSTEEVDTTTIRTSDGITLAEMRTTEDLEKFSTEKTTAKETSMRFRTRQVDSDDLSTTEILPKSDMSPEITTIKEIEENLSISLTRKTTVMEEYSPIIVEQNVTDDEENYTRTNEALTILKSSPIKIKESICTTAICNETASQILGQMDHSDSKSLPCEDFYQFSCGDSYFSSENSENLHILTEQLFKVGNDLPKYMKEFRTFYDSCLQYENDFNYAKRVEGVKKLLARVGQFQLESENEFLSENLTELVSRLIMHQSMPLFDIGVDIDKETSNLILQITLPQKGSLKMGIDDWSGLQAHEELCLKKQKLQLFGSEINLNSIYQSYVNCLKNYSNYLDSISNVLNEFEIFSKLAENERLKEIQKIRMTIEFEILNQQTLMHREILGNLSNKNYDIRRISELQVQYPSIKWKNLFETITGRELAEDTTVQVYFGNLLTKIFKSLEKLKSFNALNNALLAIYANNLFINTVIPLHQSNRESFCFDLSKRLLPDVWAHIISKTVSSKYQFYRNVKVANLFGDLKKTFCNSLVGKDWIDDKSRQSLKKKCDKIDLEFFTHPDETILLTINQDLKVTRDYQTNLIVLLEHSKRKIYSLLKTPISGTIIFSYFLDPLSIKPMTFYAKTVLYVPLGLEKKVSEDLPNYLVIARAGFPLAQQIARHFDPVGMKYGINLTTKSRIAYSDLVATFDSMLESRPRVFLHKNIIFKIDNGTLSTNDRIVDSTAFRLVWDSINSTINGINEKKLMWISSTYSNEKIFFIATAQEFCRKTTILEYMLEVFERTHLPPVFRVENVMGNSKEFSNKFGCRAGSGMNPPTKVQFPYLEKPDDEYYEEEMNFSNKK